MNKPFSFYFVSTTTFTIMISIVCTWFDLIWFQLVYKIALLQHISGYRRYRCVITHAILLNTL